jgi:hypothetical protein
VIEKLAGVHADLQCRARELGAEGKKREGRKGKGERVSRGSLLAARTRQRRGGDGLTSGSSGGAEYLSV